MILDAIVQDKQRAHAERARAGESESIERSLERIAALSPTRSLIAALHASPFRPAVIAEFKRRSPSAGAIREAGDVTEIALGYAQAGAAALSILTDSRFFGGTLADLAAARHAGLPLLRKDFLLFDEDLVEARLAGADAVLLIARLLDDAALARMLEFAARLGLEALVEVHTEPEWQRALAAGATLIGVNHRDLDSLAIDLDLSARIAAARPAGVTLVAESGLRGAPDLMAMRERGCHAVLVGEALLKSPSPGAALAEWIAACS